MSVTDETTAEDSGTDSDAVAFDVEGHRVRVQASATEAECAAVACAVASHLNDEARARTRAADEREREEWAAPLWKLSSRLGVRSRCELPSNCEAGAEWRMAGRRRR